MKQGSRKAKRWTRGEKDLRGDLLCADRTTARADPGAFLSLVSYCLDVGKGSAAFGNLDFARKLDVLYCIVID